MIDDQRLTLVVILTALVAFPASAICEAGGMSKPTVSVLYSPDQYGQGMADVGYEFPNTDDYLQRVVNVFLDGVHWHQFRPMAIIGSEPLPISVDCLATGQHTITAYANACGQSAAEFVGTATASITVNSTPTISVSFEPAATGGGELSLSYNFPNTSHYLQRVWDVFINGVHWYSDRPGTQQGTFSIHHNGSCAADIVAVATACGQWQDVAMETAPDRVPEVSSLSLVKVGKGQDGKAIIEATLAYDLNNSSGTVQVELENWVDADGTQHPGYGLHTIQVPGQPSKGVAAFTFSAPSGSQQLVVRAKATSPCGTAAKGAMVECGSCPGASANPVYYSDGNMRITDGDLLPPIAGRSLGRTYNSEEQVVALFGRGWTTFFDRRVIVHPAAVSVTTAENEGVRFEESGGVFRQTWPSSDRELATLTHDSAAGTYIYRAPGATETAVFRASDGRLVNIRDDAAAHQASVTYDVQGRPATFSDLVTGVTWSLTYDGALRRVASIGVAGHPQLIWTYSYDGNGNLTDVRAPGALPWRTYEYAANRMTASRDALGNLIESHSYDADGFAISSTGDVDEIAEIEFGLPGSIALERKTRVTYRNGAVSEHSLRPVGSAWRPVHVTGGCASCGAGDATWVHDDRGRTIREQGADGYVTELIYAGDHLGSREHPLKPAGCNPQTDVQRCRYGPDALAAALLEPTGATVKTTYEHGDAAWPDKVTEVSRPSVRVPGQLQRESYVYHSSTGVLLSKTICGWDTIDNAAVETCRVSATAMYGSGAAPQFNPGGTFLSAWMILPQPNLPSQVDGPRTDVTDVTSFVYYPIDATVPALLRGRLAATRNGAGHITRYESYDVFGNLTRVVDPNNVVTEMTYDALGRPVTSTIKGVIGCSTAADPLCATDLSTTRTYEPASGPLARETRAGGGVTAYAYDTRARLHTISRGPDPSDLREQMETSYDALTGKKSLERKLRYQSGSWVESSRQSFAYDGQSRLQTIAHADGAAIHYTYDAEDRLATVRDENHTTPNTTYAYDPAGRLSAVVQTLAGAPGGVITTSYAYDLHGNLRSVTDPNGNVTTYAYDDFGQMRTQVSPVTGTTTYSYDDAGNLTQTTDANDATTVRVYDVLNRVTSATSTLAAATEVVTWTYDDTGADRFGLGRLASMSDPSGSTQYQYERRGLLRDETRALTGAQYAYTSGFQYDADGNRSVVKSPSTQLTVNYGFDYAGRPTSASQFVTEALYLPFGPLALINFANGTSQQMSFDSRYRQTGNLLYDLTEMEPQLIAGYGYDHDPAGNVTGIQDLWEPEYSRTFEYDDLNRLTAANTGAYLWRNGSYTWDRMGNLLSLKLGEIEKGPTDPLDLSRRDRRSRVRVQENRPLGRSVDFAYDNTTPRLLGLWDPVAAELTRPVTYDAAGNETSFVATRTYSPRNLLAQVTDAGVPGEPLQHKIEYTYDGRGIRVARAESPANGPNTTARRFSIYTPELQLMAVTRDNASNVWALSAADKDIHYEIVWFAGRPIAQVTPGGPTLYTFTDHLGTPILQTDATANVIWRAEYEPFGNIYEMREGKRTDQPLRLPGQEVAMNWEGQEENYNIFRWYRSGWGRYTSVDPMAPGGLGHFERGRMSRFMSPSAATRERFMRENAELSNPALFGISSIARRSTSEALSDAMNPYTYAADSPVMYTDPLGLAPCLTFSINPISGYVPAGPPGKTFKGCQYMGYCYGWLVVYEREVPVDCKCRDFCLFNIDPATAAPGPSICFNTPPWWTSAPPLLSP